MMGLRPAFVALLLCATFAPTAPASAQSTPMAALRERPAEDEIIYFVLPDRFANGDPANDRGGIGGGPLAHGFDPERKGFYNGGDLKGLTARLDYIQGLGATAIWLTPVFRNKAVQGPPGQESAGYHGYWITDFTRVNPHLGTDADFKAFVDAAHARGMKVYMDIIANHTADVIQYREPPAGKDGWSYRSKADFPWTRRGGPAGAPINEGFAHGASTPENFARLTRPDWAYTPFVPEAERAVKVPAWLNDPIHYHNRGNTTFTGENSLYGDFVGLDDLFTTDPAVIAGMIDIYGGWIDRFGVDGFRIDTAKHVDSAFWRAFVPAMLERARARGIPNFHIFGEVAVGEYDPALLARYVRDAKLPSVLDFALQVAGLQALAGPAGTEAKGGALLDRLPDDDALYGSDGEPGWRVANRLPTFVSNHDAGRFLMFARRARPGMGDAEALQRLTLAHALMFYGRGVPTVYYGDEQGFAGLGGDQDSRQTLFASRVPTYAAETLPGTGRTGAQDNFNVAAPLYRGVAAMAAHRRELPQLRRGRQVARLSTTPGLVAFSRLLEGQGEVLVAMNATGADLEANLEVEAASLRWRGVAGDCAAASQAPGSVRVRLQPLSYIVCVAEKPR